LASILGSWPNTYTFTKNNAEKTLKKRRHPNLPIVLLRPSIIGSSLVEPYPGWIDTFSAAGGLTLAGGMGIINYVPGDERNVADLVPVDYVSNSIIAATALYANKPGFNIVTVGTSHKNPLTWGKYASTTFRYLSIHPFENTPFEPGVRFI
jgi:fatty acyl-CoA reductase